MKSTKFTIEAASANLDADESSNGLPYPSVEAFIDDMLDNTIGFGSTHENSPEWFAGNLELAVKLLGEKPALLLFALFMAMRDDADEQYFKLEVLYGDRAYQRPECADFYNEDWTCEIARLVRECIDKE